MDQKFISALKQAVGPSKVLTGDEIREEYLSDATPMYLALLLRGERLPRPSAVVKVEHEEDVVEVLNIALEYRVPVVPRGGGSGVVGGALPVEGGIMLDLRKLNSIIVDEENFLVKVGAGVYGYELEERLNRMGYTLRHIPQSFYDSTVGGWIASSAVGHYSTMYGGIEDIVISMKVAIPRIGLVEVGNLPRKAVGPDLRHLFIGSEGILGVVTSATLRILPQPDETILLSYGFKSFEEGLEYIKNLLSRGVRPAVARLYDREDVALWFQDVAEIQDYNFLLLIFEGDKEVANAHSMVAKRLLPDGVVPLGEKPVEYWLKTRFKRISDIIEYLKMGILFDTLDVAGLWSVLPQLYRELKRELATVKGVIHVSAHASHFYINGGCLYFTAGGMSDDIAGFYRTLWEVAGRVTRGLNATISHHHGVGILKKAQALEELGKSVRLLQLLKGALDPEGLLNPGKLL